MPDAHRKGLLFFAVALSTSLLLAQQTGTVKGTLTDDSGGVIPAANVALTGGGNTRTAQTQADGSYTFSGVPAGSYTVNVNFPGFQSVSKPVTVAAGGTVQVPVQLAIISEKQEVTVAAEGGPTVNVEPDNNATALTIRGEDLQEIGRASCRERV